MVDGFAEGSVNRLARQLVTQRKTHLWQGARMFALINMSAFDGYVADWDSKYEYDHWRPYTAIREAANDGNAGTAPDLTRQPLRTTLPHPEYVSAHAVGCSASFEVLKPPRPKCPHAHSGALPARRRNVQTRAFDLAGIFATPRTAVCRLGAPSPAG